MKRLLSALLCFILCLSMLWGCSNQTSDKEADTKESTQNEQTSAPDDSTTPSEESQPEESEDTKESAETNEQDTQPDEDAIAASLMGVRQSMIDTPAKIAVAYIGYADSDQGSDAVALAKSLLPDFCKDLPFITAIDDGHIIGERYGQLYLVVPCDELASVAINYVDEDAQVEEVIYRSDYGEPVLVFANRASVVPDVQINLVDNEGNILTYYPMLNELAYLSQPSDGSVLDITPYAESLSGEYEDFLNYSWWKLPEAAELTDTAWYTTQTLDDGSQAQYHISFTKDEAYLQWNDSMYTLQWSLVTEDDVCMLKLTDGADIERSFCVIIADEYDYLYIAQDFVNDATRCDELKSVMMGRNYG